MVMMHVIMSCTLYFEAFDIPQEIECVGWGGGSKKKRPFLLRYLLHWPCLAHLAIVIEMAAMSLCLSCSRLIATFVSGGGEGGGLSDDCSRSRNNEHLFP